MGLYVSEFIHGGVDDEILWGTVPSTHVKACSCTTRAGKGWEISAALDGEENQVMVL